MKENIEEDIKILTDYMLELNADIQRAEEWVNTGVDEEKYFALKNVLDKLEELQKENEELKKELDKITHGRNRLFEYATAQQATPEMLNKILSENYIPKVKIKEKIDKLEKRFLYKNGACRVARRKT